MNITIAPGPRTGSIRVPASKSQAHRLLICAALGTHPVRLRLDGRSRDIDATAGCLRALGAEIEVQDDALTVSPIRAVPQAPCHLFAAKAAPRFAFCCRSAARSARRPSSTWRAASPNARLHRLTGSFSPTA